MSKTLNISLHLTVDYC